MLRLHRQLSSVGPSSARLDELLKPVSVPKNSSMADGNPKSFIFDSRWTTLKSKKASSYRPDTKEQSKLRSSLTVHDKQRRKRLKEDINASILASPVRLCAYTRTRKPSALMIPLALVPHPHKANEDWIMPDFDRKAPGKHIYISKSRKILEALGTGRNAWKRLQIEEHEGPMTRKVVWRPDMIAHIEQEMVRCKPLVDKLEG
jgi:predicted RNA-binding protein YlxR (DUF448 family)